MKEYLFKYNDQYTLVELSKEDAESNPEQYIEVPEGATYYAIDSNLGIKKNYFFRCPNDAIWVDSQWMSASFSVAGQTVLWQRHTQPEELPFIDDEPKITTAKGGELDYIAKIHDMRDRYDGESDEDYRYQLEHYISRKESSLNDQYAEIEQVRQSGMKFDSDKPRYSLLPKGAVNSVIDVLEFGAKKYSADNWQEVDNAKERYYNAAMRHIDLWWNGEKLDSETNVHHLAHAATNLFFLMWFDNK